VVTVISFAPCAASATPGARRRPSTRDVAGARGTLEQISDDPQHLVADKVGVPVADGPDVVEVGHDADD